MQFETRKQDDLHNWRFFFFFCFFFLLLLLLLSCCQQVVFVGTKAFFEEHVPLDQALKLTVDGRRVDLPPDVFGLMILNINSYAGGADLYNSNEDKDNGSSGFRPQCFYDGKIEVVGVSGTFNLGAAAVGLSEGIRIAQGSELAIEFNDNRAHTGLWYQLDGEPASDPLIAPSVIRIRSLFEEQPTRVLCKE